jgi:glycosyltransferase involved in cell wall biosynthesis
LFEGAKFETINPFSRFWRQLKALWRCDVVLMGVPYNEPDVIVLSWVLWLLGVKVIALSESKFDDSQRSVRFELFKSLILAPYCAAIVGAQRHAAYFRFLGFRKRPLLPGYDSVGLDRVRALAGGKLDPDTAIHAGRPFVYVGRFVAKKNLIELVEAYAGYVALEGKSARRLVLIGSGEDEAAIRACAEELGVLDRIDFPGFLGAQGVAKIVSDALALVLPSREEQWGQVVNEALALGLPAIVSTEVGARDVLVRNLVNGFVIEPGSVEGFAVAMHTLSSDEALWRRMVAASHRRSWLGDADRLGDAVEFWLNPGAEASRRALSEFIAETGWSTRRIEDEAFPETILPRR